jgi:acyl-coenzyme A synthetase/AMP-(fatty) acid ligase
VKSPRSPTRNCSPACRKFANALKSLGVKKGDRVIIYMPMSVEGIVAMQACARIGATTRWCSAASPPRALRDRIEDAGAVPIITADEQCRGGKNIPLKPAVDEALTMGGTDSIKNVVVYQRTGGPCNMVAGRDLWWHDVWCRPVRRPANRNGSMPSIRCSCSTPPVPPASPRASSTPPAATCCMPS